MGRPPMDLPGLEWASMVLRCGSGVGPIGYWDPIGLMLGL